MLQMRYSGGWGTGVIAELRVDSSGEYEFRDRADEDAARNRSFKTYRGHIARKDLLAFLRKLAAANPGPAANDAGEVVFEWSSDGRAWRKVCYAPHRDPCRELLEEARRLISANHQRR